MLCKSDIKFVLKPQQDLQIQRAFQFHPFAWRNDTCQVSPAQRWICAVVGLASQWFDPFLWISKI